MERDKFGNIINGDKPKNGNLTNRPNNPNSFNQNQNPSQRAGSSFSSGKPLSQNPNSTPNQNLFQNGQRPLSQNMQPNSQPNVPQNGQRVIIQNGKRIVVPINPQQVNVQNPQQMGQQKPQQVNGQNAQPVPKKAKPLKPKNKKAIILTSIIFSVLAVVGVIIGISMSTPKKDYSVNLIMGPFESSVTSLTVKEGDIPSVPTVENIMSTDGQKTLAEFTGWFVDDERTQPYTLKAMKSDIILYAGYSLGSVTSTFYTADYYNADGSYIYLTTINTTYYTGEINFSSLKNSLENFTGLGYNNASFVKKFNNVTFNQSGTLSVSTENYASFFNKYYSVSTFSSNQQGTNIYTVNSKISTPKNDSVFYVTFEAKYVTLNFNSNFTSLKNYYSTLDGFNENDFEDSVVSKSGMYKYNSAYTFNTFPSYGFENNVQESHEFLGWSLLSPDIDENGEIQNALFGTANSFYKYGEQKILSKEFLAGLAEVTFYAVWGEITTNFIIYIDYNSSGRFVQTPVSTGIAKSISDWTNDQSSNLQKDGYALVGFNTKADLTGLALNANTEIKGGVNSPYYDNDFKSIVLYAVYKKIVNNVYIQIGDDATDSANISSEILSNIEESIVLNLGNDNYLYLNELNIVVSYDSTNKRIVITNLLESSQFALPDIGRENYTLSSYQVADKTIQKSSTYTLTNSDIVNSNIVFQTVWTGNSRELVINKYNIDENSFETISLFLTYGTTLRLTYKETFANNKTTLVCSLYNNSTNQLLSNGTFTIERVGYFFTGFLDAENGDELGSSFCINKNFENIFATWDLCTYNIQYILNGGEYASRDDEQDVNAPYLKAGLSYNSTVTLLGENEIAKDGYYFEGWGYSSAVTYPYNSLSATITTDLTLYAVWTRINKVITYLDASKTENSVIYVARDSQYILSNNCIDNFYFSEFNTKADGTGTSYLTSPSAKTYSASEATSPNGDIELYAMWFTVEWTNGDSGEGVGVEGNAPNSYKISYNATLSSLPANPFTVSNFYKFNGWKYNGNIHTSFTADSYSTGLVMLNSNIGKTLTFSADWTLKNVRVKIYSNTTTSTAYASSSVNVNNISTYTLSSGNNNLPFIDANHQIDYMTDLTTSYYWLDGANRIIINVPTPNDSMTYDSANEEFVYSLYAVWKKCIKFYANNGTNNFTVIQIASIYDTSTYVSGIVPVSAITDVTSLILPSAEDFSFSSSYREFSSWGNSSSASYSSSLEAGDVVTVTADTNYYAVWLGNSYTFNFVDETGNNSTISVANVPYGSTILLNAVINFASLTTEYLNTVLDQYMTLTSLEYRYTGGSIKKLSFNEQIYFATLNNEGFIDESDLTDGVITIYATWEEKTYSVVVNLNGASWKDTDEEKLSNFSNLILSDTKMTYTVTYSQVKSSADGLSILSKGLSRKGYRFHSFTFSSPNQVLGSTNYTYNFWGTAFDFNLANGGVVEVLWQEVFYLNYDENGGDIDLTEIYYLDVTDDSATFTIISSPGSIKRTGCSFVGLYYDESLKGIYTGEEDFYLWGNTIVITRDMMIAYGDPVTNTLTLYVVWRASVIFTYERDINLFPNNLTINPTGHYTAESSEVIVTTAPTFTINFFVGTVLNAGDLAQYYYVLNVEIFEQSGWKYAGNFLERLEISGSISLLTVWISNPITIELQVADSNKNYVFATSFTIYSSEYSVDLISAYLESLSTTDLPFLFGYNFVGFKADRSSSIIKESTTVVYDSSNLYVLPTNSKTLYAVYEYGFVKVSYDKNNNNATFNNPENAEIFDASNIFDSSYTLNNSITYNLEYFSIAGWTTSGSSTVFNSTNNIISLTENSGLTMSFNSITSKYDYSLRLFAVWERNVSKITINLNGGKFNNNGADGTLTPFYTTTDNGIIKSFSGENTGVITLYAYTGSITSNFGYRLPSNDYLTYEGFSLKNYRNLTDTTFNAEALISCETKSPVNLYANWLSEIEIRVYSNVNSVDTNYISVISALTKNVKITILSGVFSVIDTTLTFEKEHYRISSLNSSRDGTGYEYQNMTYGLNLDNFNISNGIAYIYCQWIGVNVTITIDMADGNIENPSRNTVITTTYGANINLFDYYKTTMNERADGDIAYIFDYYIDEDGNEYNENNKIFNALNVANFKENGYVILACWTDKYFTVTFNFGNTTYNGTLTAFIGQSTIVRSYKAGDTVPLISGTNCVNYEDIGKKYPVYFYKGFTDENGNLVTTSFKMGKSDIIMTIAWATRAFKVIIEPTGELLSSETNYATATYTDISNSTYTLSLSGGKLIIGGTTTLNSTINFSLLPKATNIGYVYEYAFLINFDKLDNTYSGVRYYDENATFTITADMLTNSDNFWNATNSCFDIMMSLSWQSITYTVTYEKQLPLIENSYLASATSSILGQQATSLFSYDKESFLEDGYSLFGWTQLGWTTQLNYANMTVENMFLFNEEDDDALNTAQIYNFTTIDKDNISIYPIWVQNDFTVNFTDSKGENVANNITFKYDDVLSLATLFSNTIINSTFNTYYYSFKGFSYVGDASGKVYDTETNLLFSTSILNNGFINSSDLDDSTITFISQWEEVSYNLLLELNDGTYSSRTNIFKYNYDLATASHNITYKVKYSQISSGISFASYMGLDESLLMKGDYTFAGWSSNESVQQMHFLSGEEVQFILSDIENTLDENGDYTFTFYAMWNSYLVQINANGGSGIASTTQIADDLTWKIQNDYANTYTYYGAYIELTDDSYNLIERENHHVALDTLTMFTVTGNVQLNVDWIGNIRHIVLDPNNGGQTGGSIDSSSLTDFTTNTSNTYSSSGYASTSMENGSIAYYYDETTQTSVFTPYSFGDGQTFPAGTTYYSVATEGIVIQSYYGATISGLNYITASGFGVFQGWIDGENNYSTRDLIVKGTDNSLIYLYPIWANTYAYFELNGGIYDYSNTINYLDYPINYSEQNDNYYVTMPPITSVDYASLGPAKTGYNFIGWSNVYKNYNEYISINTPEALIYPNTTTIFSMPTNTNVTFYAIYQPLAFTFQFYSKSSDNDTMLEGANSVIITITLNYGDTFYFPIKGDGTTNGTIVNAWNISDKVFSNWKIISTQYSQGYKFKVDSTSLSVINSNIANITSAIKVYSVWMPANVVVKVRLGYSNQYNYIGNNDDYDIVYDGTATYLISENEFLSSVFVLPALTDFYMFGKCATNYLDSDGGTILSTATYISISSNKLESELDSKGRYVYIISLNWTDAECYIKDYYGMGTNIHYFFTEFNKALTFVSTDLNCATSPDYEIIILPKTSNISLSSGVTIFSEINLKISLDSSVISNVTIVKRSTFTGNYLFNITNGSLTFGQNTKATLVIDGTFSSARSLIKLTNSTLTLESGVTIKNCRNNLDGLGGVIYAVGSTVNFLGARFESNSVTSTSQIDVFGGVVYAVNSTVNITSGVFLSNTISGIQNAYGGAVAVFEGVLNITGGYFKSNIASSSNTNSYGGAITVESSTFVFENAINDIVFETNSAVNGGAIYINDCEDVSISNLSSIYNSATNGGGAYVINSSASINNSSFTYNSASFGGGIFSTGDSSVEIESVSFSNNSSAQGGGIYLDSGTFTIISSEFVSNRANSTIDIDGNGGAICAVESSTLSILEGNFTSNSALNGGAIFVGGSSTLTTNKNGENINRFTSNTATNGGGVYFASESIASTLSHTLFMNNSAKNVNTSIVTNGGAVFFECGTINLFTVMAYGNTATNGGAFFIFEAVVNATLTDTFYSYTETYQGTTLNDEGEEVPYTEVVEVNQLGDNLAQYGGAYFISTDGVLTLISGIITSNYASISGGAIYNNGYVTIITPTFELNTSKEGSVIVNAGTFEFSGLATFERNQNIFIAQKNVNSYYYITVNMNNYNNGEKTITLSFDTESYLLNVPVVMFSNSTYFENYKTAEQVFSVKNEDIFIITNSKTESALVLLHQKYNLFFNDISKDAETIELPQRIVFTYDELISQNFIDEINLNTTERTDYVFKGWAYYYTSQNNIGIKSINVSTEIYDILINPESPLYFNYGYFNNLINLDEFYLPPYDIYLYAVWEPNTYNIVYKYDTYYDGVAGVTSYEIDGTPISNSNLAQLSLTVNYGKKFSFLNSSVLNSVEIIELSTINNQNPTHFNKENATLVNSRGKEALIYPERITYFENDESLSCDIYSANGNYYFDCDSVTYMIRQIFRPDSYVLSYYKINGNEYNTYGKEFTLNSSFSVNLDTREIVITLYFVKISLNVEINSNGGEGDFILPNYKIGDTFITPNKKSVTNYNSIYDANYHSTQFIYKQGYELLGFATSLERASNGQIDFAPGASVVLAEMSFDTNTFYAVWTQAVCHIKGVISFNGEKNIYYSSLDTAIIDVNNSIYAGFSNYTIVLISSTTISSSHTISKDLTILPNVKGIVLTLHNSFSTNSEVFKVLNSVTFTLGQSSVGETFSTLTFSGEDIARLKSAIFVAQGGNLVLNSNAILEIGSSLLPLAPHMVQWSQ